VVIETAQVAAVLFGAPLIELLPPGSTGTHPTLRDLGPDLLSPDFDPMEALARLQMREEMEIGEVLLDQKVMAGIGNVYKSEVLFLCGIHPFDRVKDMDDKRLLRIICTARNALSCNLGFGMRRTRPTSSPHRFWVYGRAGRPCFRCGTRVKHRRQGDQARSTYWCPVCQPAGSRGDPPSRVKPS
jgi:endonuclease-8